MRSDVFNICVVCVKAMCEKNMKRHERENEGSKEMSTTESNINPANKEKKKNKQPLLEHHTFQWVETENAIPYWWELLCM